MAGAEAANQINKQTTREAGLGAMNAYWKQRHYKCHNKLANGQTYKATMPQGFQDTRILG